MTLAVRHASSSKFARHIVKAVTMLVAAKFFPIALQQHAAAFERAPSDERLQDSDDTLFSFAAAGVAVRWWRLKVQVDPHAAILAAAHAPARIPRERIRVASQLRV